MNETIDDLTIAFSEDTVEKVRELDKCVLTKGAWTTIMFCYQDFEPSKQEFGPIKYSIRRYQKQNNQFWLKSKFNISNESQAAKIIEVLGKWIENSPEPK